jgi:hypothetical protein
LGLGYSGCTLKLFTTTANTDIAFVITSRLLAS